MKKHFVRALLVATLMAATPVRAEGTAKDFLASIDGENEGTATILGVMLDAYGMALLFASIDASTRGVPKTFCLPDALVITTDQNIDILRRAIEVKPYIAEVHPALALLKAYEVTFPCSSAKQ